MLPIITGIVTTSKFCATLSLRFLDNVEADPAKKAKNKN